MSAPSQELSAFVPQPDQPPPLESSGIIGWLRQNLFSTWLNTLLTLGALLFLWKTVPPLLSWAVFNATWDMAPQPCDTEKAGACWTFVFVKFRVLMVGLYPEQFLWRPVACFFIFTGVCLLSALRVFSAKVMILVWALLPLPLFVLINGGLGLDTVEQSLWGGLMLSTGLASIGILLSIPLGVLLALGRRSSMIGV